MIQILNTCPRCSGLYSYASTSADAGCPACRIGGIHENARKQQEELAQKLDEAQSECRRMFERMNDAAARAGAANVNLTAMTAERDNLAQVVTLLQTDWSTMREKNAALKIECDDLRKKVQQRGLRNDEMHAAADLHRRNAEKWCAELGELQKKYDRLTQTANDNYNELQTARAELQTRTDSYNEVRVALNDANSALALEKEAHARTRKENDVTKREHFAMAFAAGMIANGDHQTSHKEAICRDSVACADALIEALAVKR